MRGLILLMCMGCGRIGFPETPDSTIGDSTQRDGRVVDAALQGSGADAPLTLAPIAYWRFDELTGTTAADSSGNNHPMSMINGPTWGTGQIVGAATGDGLDDYGLATLEIPSTTSALTVSFWVIRTYTSGPRHTLLELTTNFNNSTTGFGIFPDDNTTCFGGKLMIGVRGDVGYSMRCYTQPTSGDWHHFVVVLDKSLGADGEIAFYLDGAGQTAAAVASIADNTNTFVPAPLYLFSRGGTMELNAGTVDELKIFDRALTPAEIASL
jgi:hypothetical protein